MPLAGRAPAHTHFLRPINIGQVAKSGTGVDASTLSFRANGRIRRSRGEGETLPLESTASQQTARHPDADSELLVPSLSEVGEGSPARDRERPPSSLFAPMPAQYASPYFGSRGERANRGSVPEQPSPGLAGRPQKPRDRTSPRERASGPASSSVSSIVVAVSRRVGSRGSEDRESEGEHTDSARRPNRRHGSPGARPAEGHEPSPSYLIS